jgi:molybdopterin-guanine dinucleotide biosynthesis protein A|tara:strand:+ start:417 stop:1034 length:618 start_codon:yes stop_codon:yes gene_type:complete
MSTTSIVLVGGKSVRLGRNKVTELIGNESLVQRVLSRLAILSTEIILVTAQGQEEIPDFFQSGTKVIEDIFPEGGSLGGIYTGLTVSSSSHSILVACDMPFLNVPLLGYLLEVSPLFDAVIPRVGGFLEPLHAVYSRNCITPIRHLLEQGNQRVSDFFPQIKIRYVEEEEVNRFDPEHLSFFNVNTQENLDQARRLVNSSTPQLS